MPVTRGRARLMESQEEEVEQELFQQLSETQEDQEEQEQQTSTQVETPEVDLKEMAKQLTKTLKHLLTTHRQLENDAVMIQAGMDELHRMQETRAERIGGRLKNASSTILTFGDASQGERPENECDDNEEEATN
ncbi:hypothetical protein PHYPSEUDO_006896 [Phytophthora pseudosyringae]|uniref:Uncharacterized protein n=1 Tax=Phytophthora pseudosyringae TaxID=221518 RepID=A0A8T1VMU5_9STRA|nr:hypothetical protein PHYPSEUDO_006896 [Phytophthora pseudosyringae]